MCVLLGVFCEFPVNPYYEPLAWFMITRKFHYKCQSQTVTKSGHSLSKKWSGQNLAGRTIGSGPACIDTCIHTYIRTYTHTCIDTCIHTYTLIKMRGSELRPRKVRRINACAFKKTRRLPRVFYTYITTKTVFVLTKTS